MEQRRIELANYHVETRIGLKYTYRALQFIFSLLLSLPMINLSKLPDKLIFLSIGIGAALSDSIFIGKFWPWILDVFFQIFGFAYFGFFYSDCIPTLLLYAIFLYVGLFSIMIRNRQYNQKSFVKKSATHILWHIYATWMSMWMTGNLQETLSDAIKSLHLWSGVAFMVAVYLFWPRKRFERWLYIEDRKSD